MSARRNQGHPRKEHRLCLYHLHGPYRVRLLGLPDHLSRETIGRLARCL